MLACAYSALSTYSFVVRSAEEIGFLPEIGPWKGTVPSVLTYPSSFFSTLAMILCGSSAARWVLSTSDVIWET